MQCVALLLLAIVELDAGWRLPATLPPDPQLVFRAYMPHFELFVERQRIYAFQENTQDRIRLHVVPLPRDAAGKRVFVRVFGGEERVGDAPLVVARSEIPEALRRETTVQLRETIGNITVGAFLVILGLIAIAVSQLLRRGDTRVLLYFGLFAALYGARLLADSHLPYALGMRASSTLRVGDWITYLINIPGWALARRLLGDGWKSSLRWQLYVFIAFAPFGIAFDLEQVNNVLVILGGVNILFNGFHLQRWRSLELRVILIGSLIFMAFTVSNNLSSLGVLPWNDVPETIGFLAFVLALGFGATRSVLRAERARVLLENEMQTAREIQRSILPTSMPAVNGLRFHALYDPASSVAGDLYEFLLVDDQHLGALVADVSGHGVPAALIASMMKIAVSSQSRFAHEPATLLREVNRTLRGEVRRVFVTATYLYFDMERRCVNVANAGHPPPLLLRDGEIRELGPHGVVLGRFDATYSSESLDLQPCDRIVAFTDGVTEALNARGEAFGEERLRELIRGGATAQDIARRVREWRDEKSEADDVTLLVADVLLDPPDNIR